MTRRGLGVDPRALLARPRVYSLFRRLVGRDSARLAYARDYLRARPGERVLDIGCGTGDILRYLPAVRYVGYDLSQSYIDRARERFGDRGEFHCRAVDDDLAQGEPSFDLAIAHGVLHHLDDAEAASLFRVAKRALKPGGRLVTFDGCFTHDQSLAARLFLSLDRGRHVREPEAYERLARGAFAQVRSFVRHDLIRIPYTHVILECTA
ncbi:MAG TPA: class I SAM-dependent methyltransferase [Burkholderiales bacterium]|nr:class I SAM-dependent methyltransferase [Burkholderiales bacterium]